MAALTPDDQPATAPKAEVILNSENLRELKLSGHVGFDSLPDQLVSKSLSQGFAFNILCVGETGLGKSTLMDTLFNTQFNCSPATHLTENVSVKAHTYDLQESNVRLKLTVVDSIGYADQINKDESVAPIIEYIDRQYEDYLQAELKIKRQLFNYHDTRVHVCLYFIAPTGHSLKSLDLLTMLQLDSKVNIIPVIAKSDIITKAELLKFKANIMRELAENGVHIYYFPTDDETVALTNQEMNSHLPFAVVGSTDEIKIGNKMVKARQYPWGTVQVENENHCDFVKLREMLLRTNMQDLIDTTHKKHYEQFRQVQLVYMGYSDTEGKTIRETYEKRRQDHLGDMQAKEDEMRQMFVQRVKEKESELKDSEKQLQGKLEQLRLQHNDEKRKLEAAKTALEQEIAEFRRRQEMAPVNTTSTTNLHRNRKK